MNTKDTQDNQISAAEAVLQLLKIPYKPGRREVYIDCPICHGKKKIGVNIEKSVWRCNKCGAAGNASDLYNLLRHGIDPGTLKECGDPETDRQRAAKRKSLYIEMKRALDGKGEVKLQTLRRELPKETELAPLELRDEVYQLILDSLALEKQDRKNLTDRGLSDKMIERLSYKSFPKYTSQKIVAMLREKNYDLSGIPGIYQENGEWKFRRMEGFLIPVRDLRGILARGKGYIQGFQVRNPNPKKGSPRYLYWSSAGFENGCAARSWCHFAGYPEQSVLLTEGALKADVIHELTGLPVLALMGVNAQQYLEENIELLKEAGVCEIQIAYDMDAYTNPHVLKALETLEKKLDELRICHRRLSWDGAWKGLDDYLLHMIEQRNSVSEK